MFHTRAHAADLPCQKISVSWFLRIIRILCKQFKKN